MSNDLRGYTVNFGPYAGVDLYTETCYSCGVLFAMTEEQHQNLRRSRKTFYCPNGHGQVYTGKTDKEKLREAEARETALQDQLSAAVRDGEKIRGELLRDRTRFANGVCPCCNRSFPNVRAHVATKHPDYDVTKVQREPAKKFRCSCGRKFDTLRGLHTHQSKSRRDGWDHPRTEAWMAHLTRT